MRDPIHINDVPPSEPSVVPDSFDKVVDEIAGRCVDFDIYRFSTRYEGQAEKEGIRVIAHAPTFSACLRALVDECKIKGF